MSLSKTRPGSFLAYAPDFSIRKIALKVFALLFLMLLPEITLAKSPYHIGVIYYPGWKDNDVGNAYPLPWKTIEGYPDRKPLLSYYAEGDPKILDQQLQWMSSAGLSYVVFSENYDRQGLPQLDHVFRAYNSLPDHHGIKFAISWYNNYKLPENPDQFYAMVRYWVKSYMLNPDYERIDGKPLLFVFASWKLTDNVVKFGKVSTLFDEAQKIAREAGLPGIKFVAGMAVVPSAVMAAKADGYAAVSTYNYQNGAIPKQQSHSYPDLAAGYSQNWMSVAASAPPMTYIVPMTRGWDHTPWGPSRDPLHDNSRGTPEMFETHLLAGRKFIDDHRSLTQGYGILCCWNEFGEGSYIEPTQGERFASLDAIRRVFGTPAP